MSIPKFTSRDRVRWDKKVEKTDGCWVWTAGTNKKGYGQFRIGPTVYLAHRVAYAQAKGPIPKGLLVRHMCPGTHDKATRRCVNPDHLEPGTELDNGADKRACGSGRGKVNGTKNGRAKLSDVQVAEIRRRHKAGEKQIELAREFGVSRNYVYELRKGNSRSPKPKRQKRKRRDDLVGDVDLVPTEKDIKRFWKFVDKSDGCWAWNAATDTGGYGAFRCQGRTRAAHRISYIIAGGQLVEGLDVAHTCANDVCVRPDHLEQKTRKANMANKKTRKRLSEAHKGNQANRKLTDDQIRYVKERFRDDPTVLAPQVAAELDNIVTAAAIANIRKGKTGRHVHVPGFTPVMMGSAWRRGRGTPEFGQGDIVVVPGHEYMRPHRVYICGPDKSDRRLWWVREIDAVDKPVGPRYKAYVGNLKPDNVLHQLVKALE